MARSKSSSADETKTRPIGLAAQVNSGGWCSDICTPNLLTDLVIALGYVLDVQDNPCRYHAWKVAGLSTAMALEIAPEQAADVFLAGLLHDIGGIGQFSHMFRYSGIDRQLANAKVRSHPDRGFDLLQNVPGMEIAAQLVADHHEWWNGTGYPSRKSADEIPIGAQLIRMADSADLNKLLRAQTEMSEIAEWTNRASGTEVSHDVADVFLSIISESDFRRTINCHEDLHAWLEQTASSLEFDEQLKQADTVSAFLHTFAGCVDAKHEFAEGHSERVSAYSVELADVMGLPQEEIVRLRFAAMLHDAGKVCVPNSIMEKTGPLTPIEFTAVKRHAILSMEILNDIVHMPDVGEIVRHHHERWDGLGYPDGLHGEEIPLLSRIMAVADAADAIISARPYKPSRSLTDTLGILTEAAGTQFDPDVIRCARLAWGER